MERYFNASFSVAIISIPFLIVLGLVMPGCKAMGCGPEKILVPVMLYLPIYVHGLLITILAHLSKAKVNYKKAYWFFGLLPVIAFVGPILLLMILE